MNLGGIIYLNKTSIGIFSGALLFLFLYMTSYKNDLNNVKLNRSNKINMHKLLNIAIKAAENGGREVIQSKDNINIQKKGLTKEGLIDSVTTADFLSHCAMMRTLEHFYPSLKIVSEEAKTRCHKNQYVDLSLPISVDENESVEFIEEDVTVWIDPLDATYEYTEKLYKYVTVMVCVAVKGKPIIGVIHKPFDKSTSWAWVNTSKSKDLYGQVHNKDEDILKIIISRSHKGQIEEVLHKNFNNKIQLVIAAGAGYKALEVAKGNVDAYLHITAIKKWDICAGNAIINALGGKMTTKYNEEIDYSNGDNVKIENGLIATMRNHNLFLEKL
ncbi:putative inositol monophosphatase 3 [Anoplophora glabripennis]|uniref:putative inositol monophosphatase 3 n=1 Tax=Anoplophora glabripennis TaxID=217634 RepID=UPI0008753917|nr:putative inositol monophosphatase 3 [Anoplophora glabripennis]